MTLVEVSVVVVLLSILLGIVIPLAISLRQWDERFRDHSLHSGQLARLAETIRADIRQATGVSLADKKILVIKSSDENNQTRYELMSQGCRRSVGVSGAAPIRSDDFTIGPVTAWSLEQGVAGRRPAFVVTLERPDSDSSKVKLTPLVVIAALGADTAPASTAESAQPTTNP